MSRLGSLEALEARSLMAGLIQPGDLNYQGAFNVPMGEIGSSTFEYGGTALAYNPANDSLFAVGHDWDQAVAEISIPAPGGGDLSQLPTAEVLQPFTPVLSRIPNYTLEDTVKVGGLMVHGSQLVGTAYEYYDGDGDAIDSHFKIASQTLEGAYISGLHQVGNMGGGFVGGYMAEVPAEWQDDLGTQYLTGQAGLSIISRTSAGPALFGFDPDQVGAGVAEATPLVYYPISNPLAPETTQNPIYNTTSEIFGVVFPEGTDSVLFFGSHGTGEWWYGEADEGGYDPYRTSKGPHAPDYVYQVWAYDVHDLVAVKNGQLQPWEVQPYDVWTLDFPYYEGSKHIGGVAYDPETARLFVSQQYGNEFYPVIHTFQVGTPTGGQNDQSIQLQNVIASLPENTAVVSNFKVADITTGGGNGPMAITLTGPDAAAFVVEGSGLYLRAGTSLDYETKPSYSITVQASDGSSGSAPVTADYTLQVSQINDAPVLDTAPYVALPAIGEDAVNPGGVLVSALLAGAVRDADSFALQGMALVSASNDSGRWQFSVDGGTSWQEVGYVAENSALLLAADAVTRIRFLPAADFNGLIAMSYRAWDRTQGVAGSWMDLSGRLGGTNAFSTAIETAIQAVDAVNDAPVLNASLHPEMNPIWEDVTHPLGTPVWKLIGGISDVDVGARVGIAVINAPRAAGNWQFSLNDGVSWQDMGVVSDASARLLSADGITRIRFLPKPNYNGTEKLYFRAWDLTQGRAGDLFTVTGNIGRTNAFSTANTYATLQVMAVNDPPSLTGISGTIGYTNNTSAIQLAPKAVVRDSDSNFDGGVLTVRITEVQSTANRIQLGGTMFTVDASRRLLYDGLIVGWLNENAGEGLTKFEVHFNANATETIVQQLVRAIRFRTVGGSPTGTRTILFSLTDGGGATATATKTVQMR